MGFAADVFHLVHDDVTELSKFRESGSVLCAAFALALGQ